MAEAMKGTLHWIDDKAKGRSFLVTWTSKNGKQQANTRARAGTVASELATAKDNDIEIEYELSPDGSYPINIRRVGSTWTGSAPVIQSGRPHQGAGARGGGRGQGDWVKRANQSAGSRDSDVATKSLEGHFHNPYNFIPAVPPAVAEAAGDLRQRRPVGHKAWYEGYFTGRLSVELTVVTPLLVPDAARARKDDRGHTTLPLLTEPDGKTPKLPPTSIKGALRSAYEAITNSRFGVFKGHDTPLGRRMDAREGLAMVPARIAEDGRLELWMGTYAPASDLEFPSKCPQGNGKPPGDLMYAAWLPQYDRRGARSEGPAYDGRAIKYGGGKCPRHGDPVVCWLRRVNKISRKTGKAQFAYWRVEEIQQGHDLGRLSKSEPQPKVTEFGNSHQYDSARAIRAYGYVSITNQNIGSKHDERVFFVPERQRPHVVATDDVSLRRLSAAWTHLVLDYRQKAKKIIDRRKANRIPLDTYEGKDIGKTALSRHVFEPGSEKLKGGDLCFARVTSSGEVLGLYPVMISRDVARIAPAGLLPEALHPAHAIGELSPADRLFGWVDQAGGGGLKGQKRAYKGQLRIASCRYVAGTGEGGAITDFTKIDRRGLPLAILSAPKPEQARFYVAENARGAPQGDVSKVGAAYDARLNADGSSPKGLRGRKVYPHHTALPEDYWSGPGALREVLDSPSQAREVGGRFKEYLRVANPAELRDDQNRSIEGWVNPGVRFRFDLDVINLSKLELGALLYLFEMGEKAHLRMGGGKPLGFGSVRAALVGLDVADGVAIAEDLLDFAASGRPSRGVRLQTSDSPAVAEYIEHFKAGLQAAYPSDAGHILAAMRIASHGFADAKPIHYPRLAAENWSEGGPVPPDPEGKNFAWFGENERDHQTARGLDALWEPRGLPMFRKPADARERS